MLKSAGDSILFDELTPGTGWGGIRFLQADSSSVLTYCRLQHGKATGPGGPRYGPVRQYTNWRIRPRARIGMNSISESVPAIAPPGEYRYVGYVGRFQSTVWDSSYFTFSKNR